MIVMSYFSRFCAFFLSIYDLFHFDKNIISFSSLGNSSCSTLHHLDLQVVVNLKHFSQLTQVFVLSYGYKLKSTLPHAVLVAVVDLTISACTAQIIILKKMQKIGVCIFIF